MTDAYSDTQVDEIRSGIAAAGMEETIRKVVENFLDSRELSEALKNVSALDDLWKPFIHLWA